MILFYIFHHNFALTLFLRELLYRMLGTPYLFIALFILIHEFHHSMGILSFVNENALVKITRPLSSPVVLIARTYRVNFVTFHCANCCCHFFSSVLYFLVFKESLVSKFILEIIICIPEEYSPEFFE